MKRISKLLAAADVALQDTGLVKATNKKITDNVYDGYIAGFGPAVITAGLLPTLSTYAGHDKRKIVLDAIAKVANIDNKTSGENLLKHCLAANNAPNLNRWRNEIIDASVALKLMIRTYNLK